MVTADLTLSDSPYALALALTIVVEVPVYTWALTRAGTLGSWRCARWGLLVNLVSHPLVWFLIFPSVQWIAGFWIAVAAAEAFAWAIEAAVLWIFVFRRVFTVAYASLVANASSLLVGLVLLRPLSHLLH